jgi:hypothetical protein
MKKYISFMLLAAALSAGTAASAQDDTTEKKGVVKKVGNGVKKGAKAAWKGTKKGAKVVGNETAELATKGKAKLTDKKSDEWEGPNGEAIYVDDGSKYYWINEKGGRVFIAKEQLKPKVKMED